MKGTIQRRGKSWTLRIYVGKKQREIMLGSAVSLPSARARERAADNVRLRLGMGDSRTTLERFAECWFIPAVDLRLRPSTTKDYRWRWGRYLAGRVETRKQLWEYRTVDVQNILNGVAADYPKLAKASLQRIKALLSTIFRHAVVAGFREANPVRDVLLPGRATAPPATREPGVYDLVTVRKVLATRDLPPDVLAATAIASLAGLRLAELRGLRWEDVEISGEHSSHISGSITVARTVWGKWAEVNAPKSKASAASVPIIPELAAHLRRYRDWWDKQPTRDGPRTDESDTRRWAESTSLFGPKLHARLRYHLRRAFKAVGSEFRGMHAFRRGLASELFERGAEDLDVSHVLRHSKVIVTRDSYIKRFDSRVLAAMESLQNKGSVRDKKKPAARAVRRNSRVNTGT
jgi:integrase